jgi:hypothetical protein
MQRLREIREWREEFGMGVAGGPVRVAASEQPPEEPATEIITDAEAEKKAPQVAQPGEATIEFHLDWE